MMLILFILFLIIVVLDIVAGQRRKSARARSHPPSIGFDQYSDRAAWLTGMHEIMDDEWMVTVECPGRGVAAITVLSDGQADDPNGQIVDRVKAMTGSWKCDGTAAGMDGKDQKFTGTMTSKSDLDGFWVHDSFQGTMIRMRKSNSTLRFPAPPLPIPMLT